MAADEHTTVASVLTPSENGALVALGVATAAKDTALTIGIYSGWSGGPSGTLLASSTVALSAIGYQLVDLATPVPLVANQGLAVLLTYGTSGAAPVVVGGDGLYGVTTGSSGLPSYPVDTGLSYYLANSGTWVDFATKQYTATSGYGSADTLGGVVFLKGIVAVPEPSTLAISLAAIACTAWGAARRRRRRPISVLSVAVSLGLLVVGSGIAAAQSGYTSPFSITLDPAIGSWTTDFASRQAAIDANTSPRIADWYFPTVYSGSNYPYGPLNPQLYSSATIGSGSAVTVLQYDRGVPVLNVTMNAVPGGVDPTAWQRQRILAAANVLLQAGTPYQHLHLPNFDPAQVTSGTGFPWSAVSTGTALQSSWQLANGQSGTTPNPYFAAYGQPTTGIDCTDFTAYVYNLALGIQMHSGTPTQIEFGAEPKPTPGGTATATVLDSGGNPIVPQFFYGPNFGMPVINGTSSLDSLVSQFQTGDMLYMGNPHDGILHVVMWLGQTGTDSAGNTFPLVISSHDNTPAIFDTLALDATGFPSDGNVAGHLPPPGVHILPFDASNWFYQDFQVAMRVVAVPEPSALVLALAGLACGGWSLRRRRAARG